MFLFQVEIGLARTKFHRSLVEERAKNDNPILNGKGRDEEQESYKGEEERVVDEIDPEAENRREDESLKTMEHVYKRFLYLSTSGEDESEETLGTSK